MKKEKKPEVPYYLHAEVPMLEINKYLKGMSEPTCRVVLGDRDANVLAYEAVTTGPASLRGVSDGNTQQPEMVHVSAWVETQEPVMVRLDKDPKATFISVEDAPWMTQAELTAHIDTLKRKGCC